MKRGWAIAAVGITIIVFASLGVFYTGYAIDRNNKKIEHQSTVSNQKWCGILSLIVKEGRPGPFKDSVVELYNDYQCQKVEPL